MMGKQYPTTDHIMGEGGFKNILSDIRGQVPNFQKKIPTFSYFVLIHKEMAILYSVGVHKSSHFMIMINYFKYYVIILTPSGSYEDLRLGPSYCKFYLKKSYFCSFALI